LDEIEPAVEESGLVNEVLAGLDNFYNKKQMGKQTFSNIEESKDSVLSTAQSTGDSFAHSAK
jgi:hypothetical protein